MDIEVYINKLKTNGYKATSQRKEILKFFLENKTRLISAKEISVYLRNLTVKEVSYDTIYRNLYILQEIGIIESGNHDREKLFYLKGDFAHSHIFVCKECGNIVSLELCPLSIMGPSLIGYTVLEHKFELYGICPECKSS